MPIPAQLEQLEAALKTAADERTKALADGEVAKSSLQAEMENKVNSAKEELAYTRKLVCAPPACYH